MEQKIRCILEKFKDFPHDSENIKLNAILRVVVGKLFYIKCLLNIFTIFLFIVKLTALQIEEMTTNLRQTKITSYFKSEKKESTASASTQSNNVVILPKDSQIMSCRISLKRCLVSDYETSRNKRFKSFDSDLDNINDKDFVSWMDCRMAEKRIEVLNHHNQILNSRSRPSQSDRSILEKLKTFDHKKYDAEFLLYVQNKKSKSLVSNFLFFLYKTIY